MNNIRYTTATHIGNWARDKLFRCVLVMRGDGPDPVGHRLGGKHASDVRADGSTHDSWRGGHLELARSDPRGGRCRARQRPAVADDPARARARRRAGRRRHRRAAGAEGARARGPDIEDGHGFMQDVRSSSRRRGRAARPRGRARRRRLRRALPLPHGQASARTNGGARQPLPLRARARTRSRLSTPSPASVAARTRTCSPTG